MYSSFVFMCMLVSCLYQVPLSLWIGCPGIRVKIVIFFMDRCARLLIRVLAGMSAYDNCVAEWCISWKEQMSFLYMCVKVLYGI